MGMTERLRSYHNGIHGQFFLDVANKIEELEFGNLRLKIGKSIFTAVNAACGTLPEGYQVVLRIENGAAWVELDTPEGTQDVPHDDDLGECILEAIRQAGRDVEA